MTRCYFLKLFFSELGWRFTIGDALDPSALNIRIEYFSTEICRSIENFCQATGKKIAIVVTEHMDYHDGRVFAYGEPLFEGERDTEYFVRILNGVRRFAGFVQAAHSSRMLLTLGDSPPRGRGYVVPTLPCCHCPFRRCRWTR